MNGIKFYLEYPDRKEKNKGTRKKLGNHKHNVVAIIDDTRRISGSEVVSDAIGAIFYTDNSPVGSTAVSNSYLNEFCKRISEEQAREIHSELFKYLDD